MKLSQLIEQVREELQEARRPKENSMFALEECELEIAVDIETQGGADISLKIFGTGVNANTNAARTASHKVRVKFSMLPALTFEQAVAEFQKRKDILKEVGINEDEGAKIFDEYMKSSVDHTYIAGKIPLEPSTPDFGI